MKTEEKGAAERRCAEKKKRIYIGTNKSIKSRERMFGNYFIAIRSDAHYTFESWRSQNPPYVKTNHAKTHHKFTNLFIATDKIFPLSKLWIHRFMVVDEMCTVQICIYFQTLLVQSRLTTDFMAAALPFGYEAARV